MSTMRLSRAEHERLARGFRWQRYTLGYLFIAPSFLFLLLVLFIPSVWVIYLSFQKGGILEPARFVGFANWNAIFKDRVALLAIRNTLLYMLMAIPTVFAIGLGLAMLLKRVIVGSAFFKAILYFPTLTPYVMAALIWTFVIHPEFGVLNVLLKLGGLQPANWLGPDLALVSVAMLEVWRGIGFWTLLFLAALISLPEELYQAAKVDGASSFSQWRHITMPLLRPTFVFAVVMATIWNFQVFDSIIILTDGAPNYGTASVAWYVYKQTFTFSNIGVGAAMSVLMLLAILALTMVQLRVLRRRSVR
jgi:ABC-type sugar transport system permease subunit